MTEWSTVVLYAEWALEFLIYPPFLFITAGLIVGLVVATGAAFRSDRKLLQEKLPSLAVGGLSVFLFIPLLLWIAAEGAAETGPFRHPNDTGLIIANALTLISLAVAAYVVFRCKGVRWVALFEILILQWLLMGAGLIAGMALSGDWI
jgi:hypothetical protein